MQLKTLLFTTLLTLGLNLPSTLASTTPNHDRLKETTTKITLRLPPAGQNPALPNPHLLPAATHATLTTAGRALSAPLSTANTFVFRDVAPGSYLVDVHCATHGFVPYRLDVTFPRLTGEEKGDKAAGGLEVSAWETFRGNDWGNKGEGVPVGVAVGGGEVEVEVRVRGGKGYFMERSGFSVLSIFKNPVILMSLVSMGLFFGMPKLVEQMDPEMRAEWEERQKENPMNSIMGAASGQSANPIGNFDMASFLAGSGSKTDEGNGKGKAEGGKKKR